MAYTAGGQILASHFNGFIGTTVATSAYASEALSALKANALYGVGFGRYGYGQTDIVQASVSIGDTITSSQWTNLRNMLNNMRVHQVGSVTNIPPTTDLQVGDTIYAYDSTGNTAPANYDIEETTPGALFEADRDKFLSNAYTATAAAADIRRNNGNWSSSISGNVIFTWTNGDQMRHFFNQGGQLTLDLSFVSPTSTQDTWWNGFFTAVGQIRFGEAAGIPCTGSLAHNSNQGYWSAGFSGANSFANRVTIWDFLNYDAPGTNPYDAVNDIVVDANYSGTNSNGSLGNVLTMYVGLTDAYTSAFTDVVTGSGTSYVRCVPGYRQNTSLTTQFAPTITTTTTFTGS